MKIYLCIDDTDNLESIGTGELLENLCDELIKRGLAKEAGYVTRHQFYICEEIKYTSHNSSMCCEIKTNRLEELMEFSKKYLEDNSAEDSDPGLCIYNQKSELDTNDLIEFGKAAKERVLYKKDAYLLAEKYKGVLWLSEHGGTGDGAIGAIAGIGLRLTGDDGRIKGKVHPKDDREHLTVKEFCDSYDAQQVVDEESGEALSEDTVILFVRQTKFELSGGKVTAFAKKSGKEYVLRIKRNEKFTQHCELFQQDYIEECFSEEKESCYNCRYRRWTKEGFECSKNMIAK